MCKKIDIISWYPTIFCSGIMKSMCAICTTICDLGFFKRGNIFIRQYMYIYRMTAIPAQCLVQNILPNKETTGKIGCRVL